MPYGTLNADKVVNSDSITSGGLYGFKNRIINGDMRIDQRNAGASVTPTSGQYLIDRWRPGLSAASKYSAQQNAGSVTPPTGFSNYLGVTSLSAYSVVSGDIFFIGQRIEGFNTADLAFGTASAQTITASFWVRSSLTGTFCVAIGNAAFTRSYVATYTVSAANTWEYKTITIAGDTTGTWVGSTNGVGLYINFTLGSGSTYNTTANTWAAGEFYGVSGSVSVVGTNGATFYITGVQLEKGSTATSFDYRPYGTELALCQRYYFKTYAQDVAPGTASPSVAPGRLTDATQNYASIQVFFPVTMRAAPSVTVYNPSTGATASLRGDAANYAASTTATGVQNTTVFANNVSIGQSVSISAHVTAAIEL